MWRLMRILFAFQAGFCVGRGVKEFVEIVGDLLIQAVQLHALRFIQFEIGFLGRERTPAMRGP